MINIQSIVLFVISYFIFPRLTFLPQSLHSLLIIFGPFLLPRLVNGFNTARAASRSVPIRPTPPNVQYAMNLLFASILTCLVLSLPNFAPENIFTKTQSRLQIEPSVLFARLKLLRPLEAGDEVLRSKFSSAQNKLAYLVYGPDTLINCIWCTGKDSSDVQNYFLYSLPKILKPHVLHLGIIGLATSSLIGKEGARFRTHATIAGLSLLVAEAWYIATYDLVKNKRAKVLGDIDFVHWRIRFVRLVAFMVADGALALVLWLTSTNRWLAKPPSIAERLETSTRMVEDIAGKLGALSLLTNSINRDAALRGLREGYWRQEGEHMAELVQEAEVTAQINNALSRLDMQTLEGQIGQAADRVLAGIDTSNAPEILSASGMSDVPQHRDTASRL